MLQVDSRTKLGKYLFTFVNSIEITSSWENLTDTAIIKMPKKIRLKATNEEINAVISGDDAFWKRGDIAEINLGYDANLKRRFIGTVARVFPKVPIEFHCEDDMYHLKSFTVEKYSSRKARPTQSHVTIKEVLTDIKCPIPFTAEDITIGDFTISRTTIAEVLEYFKKTFGLSSYIREDGSLYVGFAYTPNISLEALPVFKFNNNIIDGDNLEYYLEDDVKIKCRAINIKSDNSKHEEVFGDPNGEERTLYFYNVKNDQLAKLADEKLKLLRYTGFRGDFKTFLEPMVRHGQAIRLVDDYFPDRNGVYLVKKVVTSLGVSEGGRQRITIDRKVA